MRKNTWAQLTMHRGEDEAVAVAVEVEGEERNGALMKPWMTLLKRFPKRGASGL